MGNGTKTIGIQIGAISFLDEGVQRVLDTVAELGAVNTICLNTYGYDIGLGGRQIPGYPYPGHGKVSAGGYVGGYCGIPNPEHYANAAILPSRDPDCGDRDLVAEVVSEAAKRNMSVYACNIDRFSPAFTEGDNFREVNHHGEETQSYCLANPDYQEFWRGLTEDIFSSYNLQGLLLVNERNGPLLTAIGATQYAVIDPANTVCFCPHHAQIAHQNGIDVERARKAYSLLEALTTQALEQEFQGDTVFAEFISLLFEYPEILAWERLWTDTKFELYRTVASAAKNGRPNLQVGFHVSHASSFNPIDRAEWSLRKLATICDYLKVVVYHHVAGVRYRQFMRNVKSAIFSGVPADTLSAMNASLLGYGDLINHEDPIDAPFPAEYVSRETQRAKRLVGDSCLIYPGIGIDISHAHMQPEEPDTTYAAVSAALRAGADGLVYSRKYSEMRHGNLTAAGNAVRDCCDEC